MTKLKNSYETVLVLSMKLGEEGIENMIKKFQDLIEANATLNNVDKWGKRRLAYVLFDFTSEADFPAELDRIYKITDGVLRSLIIKKES